MAQAENTLKRILFVDDDSNVLTGLRNVLRSKRREWDMVFAIGPEEALAKLAEGPFDVVVSDMRMPRMDGCNPAFQGQAASTPGRPDDPFRPDRT
jgi:CheY-like chemotaxis protein